jgi:hypothetical protein
MAVTKAKAKAAAATLRDLLEDPDVLNPTKRAARTVLETLDERAGAQTDEE